MMLVVDGAVAAKLWLEQIKAMIWRVRHVSRINVLVVPPRLKAENGNLHSQRCGPRNVPCFHPESVLHAEPPWA